MGGGAVKIAHGSKYNHLTARNSTMNTVIAYHMLLTRLARTMFECENVLLKTLFSLD